jgi:hypothetical protein
MFRDHTTSLRLLKDVCRYEDMSFVQKAVACFQGFPINSVSTISLYLKLYTCDVKYEHHVLYVLCFLPLK